MIKRKTISRKFADAAYVAVGVCLIAATAMLPIFSTWVLAIEDEPVLENAAQCESTTLPEETGVEVEPDSAVETPEVEDPEVETLETEAVETEIKDETQEDETQEKTVEEKAESLPEVNEPSREEIAGEDNAEQEFSEGNESKPALEDEGDKETEELDGEMENETFDSETVAEEEGIAVKEESITEIENSNTVDICNDVDSVGNTGGNEIESEETASDTEIETGDVNVYANVLNIVNTNNINSEIVQITENFNNLSADILMNQPETTPTQMSHDLVAGLCQNIHCQSLTTFKLTNSNNATVNNDIDLAGNSGGNSISGAGENSAIRTGTVNALVNIINIVNNNVINSRWTIATFNIFGDWEGDLVLPSELYFDQYTTVGADTGVTEHNMNKIVLNVNNNNQAAISNNVNANANSGGNTAKGAILQDASTETGDSESLTNVKNMANVSLVNSSWFLNIVNTLGSWTGNVYSLPENMDFEQTPLGMTFFSASGADENALQEFHDAVGGLAQGDEVTIEIENNNKAVINNNVDVQANSGGNEIDGGDLQNTRIITGYSRALANILNFANINLINSNLNVGLTNIFGSWNGNIVFGYPDLAVNQSLLQGAVPVSSGSRVNYELQYSNNSGSTMSNAVMAWTFDPQVYSFSHANIKGLFPVSDGVLEVKIGKLVPMASGRVQVQLNTKVGLEQGFEVETVSEISGGGPEKNLDNNTHVLTALASASYNEVPELPNPNVTPGAPFAAAPPVTRMSAISSALFTKVTKVNDSAGRELKAGDSVKFTITIENQNTEKIYSAVMKDQMVGPDGNTVSFDEQELGELLPNENIIFEYSLEITQEVMDGTYTNYFWIEGLDNMLRQTKTLTASSAFAVKQDPVMVINETEQLPQVTIVPDRQTITRVVNPAVTGGELHLPPLVLGSVIDQTQADDGFNEPQIPGSNELMQLIVTLVLVVGSAAGYAIYKSMHRTNNLGSG